MIFTPQKVEARIIDAFERAFITEYGPARAFFQIPQRNADPVRVVYVVYAAMGPDLDKVHDWFFEHVVDPLISKAAGGWLYWRNPERVLAYGSNVVRIGEDKGHTPLYKIRTRLAVLDMALNPVTLGDPTKHEGVNMVQVDG